MLQELLEKLENKDISVLFKKTEEQLFKEFPDLVLFLSNQSGDSLREKLFLKLFKRKKCECGKETVFDSNKFDYRLFCSRACSNRSEKLNERKNKSRISNNLKKYGVDYPQKLAEIKKKVKETNIERYGEDFVKKRTVTLRENFKKKYGNDITNCSQLDSVKEKKIKVCQEKYGVDNPFKSNEIKEKIRKRNIEKHGELPGFGSKKFKEKVLEKYGVENIAQHLPTFEKRLKSSYKLKEYLLPSGNKVLVQGFENKVLDYLFITEKIKEEDILINNIEIEAMIGEIFYFYKNKKRRYYPDLFIKSKKLVIEVKSSFTETLKRDQLQLKADVVRSLGYNYLIYIPNNKEMIIKENFLNNKL